MKTDSAVTRLCWILGLFLFATIAVISGIHGFVFQAILSLLVLTLVLYIAYPLSRFLFHSRIDSIVFALPIGWAYHSVLLALWGWLFGINATAFIAYLALSIVIAFVLLKQTKKHPKLQTEPESIWTATDTLTLLIWVFVVVLLIAIPLIHVGAPSEKGFAYRAYFNADFFRNMAVVGALGNSGIPPNNPYFSGVPLHYYWFFHVLLAFWKTLFFFYRLDYLLVQFTLVSVVVFASTLFVILRKYLNSRRTLYWMLPLFLIGGSYKAFLVLHELHHRHLKWTAFVVANIEGFIRWLWKAPQIDPLYRALLFAPQHLMALALFLLVLILFQTSESKIQRLLTYSLLFISVGFSVILGAIFSVIFGMFVLSRALSRLKERWWEIPAFGFLGVSFLLLYTRVLRTFDPEVSELRFEIHSEIFHRLPAYLILNWGALLPLGIAGIIWHQKSILSRKLLIFLAAFFSVISFMTIDLPGASDLSLKAGYASDLILLIFAALFIDWVFTKFPKRQTLMKAILMVLLIPASVSWLMDAYNCQDIKNVRFTTYISPEKAEILEWMRRNLPKDTVTQQLYAGKGYVNQFVSEVPAFAERSEYLGDRNFSRIFQIPKKKVEDRENLVRKMFRSESPASIVHQAREHHIEYLFIGNSTDEDALEFVNELVCPPFTMMKRTNNTMLVRVDPKLEVAPIHKKVLLASEMRPILEATFLEDFYPPETHPITSAPMRWLGNEGTLLLESQTDLSGNLKFNVSSFWHDRSMEIYLNDHLLRKAKITVKGIELSLPIRLKSGTSRVVIRTIEPPEEASTLETNGDHRLLSLKIMGLRFVRSQT
jgi:hypothetical protein